MISNGFDEFQHVVAPPLTGGQSLERFFAFSRYDIVEFGQISHHQEIVALEMYRLSFRETVTTTISSNDDGDHDYFTQQRIRRNELYDHFVERSCDSFQRSRCPVFVAVGFAVVKIYFEVLQALLRVAAVEQHQTQFVAGQALDRPITGLVSHGV